MPIKAMDAKPTCLTLTDFAPPKDEYGSQNTAQDQRTHKDPENEPGHEKYDHVEVPNEELRGAVQFTGDRDERFFR